MAKAIVSCTGETINVGDKVRTEFGDVIEVCGGTVNEHKMFNAETCAVVPADTPLTNTGTVPQWNAAHSIVQSSGNTTGGTPPPTYATDCVVWGT